MALDTFHVLCIAQSGNNSWDNLCRAQYGNMIKNAEDNAKKALRRLWTNYTGEAEVIYQ